MSISPVNPINNISNINSVVNQSSKTSTDNTFKNMLGDLINNVNTTDSSSQQDIYKIASGGNDDLHTMPLNSSKAELAILTAVQVRNKILDAYKEIMNVTM